MNKSEKIILIWVVAVIFAVTFFWIFWIYRKKISSRVTRTLKPLSDFENNLMKKSGAGSDWKYSPSHSTYIVDSIKNRKENNSNRFKGYRPEEVKLEIGDLVGKARQSGVNYDTLGNYKSHTDIVVKINNGYADTIGGNVGDTVKVTRVPLTPDGKVDLKRSDYFVVIKSGK